MGGRFVDRGRTIYDFGERFLVRCPRCSRRAEVFAPQGDTDLHAPRRVSCVACGYTRPWTGDETSSTNFDHHHASGSSRGICVGGPFDWYFGLSVWLQTPCCGHVLWAYNAEHLSFLRRYVGAEVRERAVLRNASLASRLPKWIKSAKNRDEVLRGVDRLEGLLLQG
jgi:hypothetical protein